jgi:hypothetical protein
MQPQPQIAAGCEDRVRVGGKVHQQAREQADGLLRVKLVQIINHQCDAVGGIGEFREHPVDHRPPVELRRRCWRFRLGGCGGGITDRAEQGKPELLSVVLVARHLQHGESMSLTRTIGPRAQQRRLPTAGGSRDDRHLPSRRAIQGSKKLNPVDQPGSCPIHLQMPALLPAPYTDPPATQSSRYQARVRTVNGADHPDLVTTSHLPGGHGGALAARGKEKA